MNQTEAFPLIAAYQFGDARGLATEVEAVRRMRIDTPVRRGYIARLFGDRQLLNAFMDECWVFGRTPAGQKKLKYYERLRKRHEDLSRRVVTPPDSDETRPLPVTVDDLAKWRRELLRVLDSLDARAIPDAGPIARITRLKSTKVIPRHIAALMITVLEMRNVVEYENKELTLSESLAVRYAWVAALEWARPK
jgi:hypothetical protein